MPASSRTWRACGLAALLAGCSGGDGAGPVRSLDDPRLRDGGIPPSQLAALDFNMTPAQLAVLDPAYGAGAPPALAIAGANRVGDDLVTVRLRAHRPDDPGNAPEWSYAVDCRSGQSRLLGAGVGIGAGLPSAAAPSAIAPPATQDASRAFDLICAHRVDCEFSVRGNRCEQAMQAWIDAHRAADAAPPR